MTRFSSPKRLNRDGKLSEFYYVRVNEDGRRSWRSTGQKTLELAKQVLRTWQVRDAKGELHVEDAAFDEAADTWLEGKKARVSPGCHTVYRVYVGHWKAAFSARNIRSLEPADVEKYLKKRKADGLAPRSLNDERSTLRSFLSWAVDLGYISRNPIARVEKFREPKRAIRVLEPEEEDRLLEEARKLGEAFHGAVLCLLQSGLRRGAVGKLEWTDIDFRRGEWRLPAAKVKAREDFVGRPIAPALLAWLRDHAGTSGLVFGRLDSKKWSEAVKAAGFSWLRPHDLRRNFITRCRRAGVPLEVAMYLSDHRDVAVVLACYRAVDSRDAKAAMAKLYGKAAAGPAALTVDGGAATA
jgi:integrase